MQENSQPRSNKERSERTRGTLIEAARSIFVDKGYAVSGTPEIVAAAGLTRGALYHHFQDKEDLFRAVVANEATAVAAQIRTDTAQSASAMDALVTGADAYFDAMASPDRVRLLLLDGPAVLGHEEMRRIDSATGGGELRAGLASAAPEGQLEGGRLDALSELLSAAFDRAALAIAQGGARSAYQAAIRLMIEGIVAAKK